MRSATIYNLNLRVGAGIQPIVKVSQNDEGRSIGFRLFDGALAYLPGATAEVTITGTKPSGLGFTETCSVSGSVAFVDTTLSMTQESGQINAELRISDGTIDIGTANFTLYVEPAPHPEGTTDGTTEEARTVLEQCEQYAQEAQEAAEAASGDYTQLSAEIGTLSELTTTAKSSAVAAINEVNSGLSDAKADLEDLDERVDALEAGGSGSGLTDDVKTALMNLVNHIGVWTDENAQTYITALYDALYPPADLVSISAVYTQSGTVYDTNTLDSLKSDLVVTALMSDQTTRPVTSYTLSGTLTEGTSTITVTYGGKTATFTVTVSHVKQVVRHYFSELEYTDGKLIKTNKSQVSISNSGHVIIPYVQGMTVVTVMPSNWIGNYPAIMKDNGTSYSNANAVQGETVSSNIFVYSQAFDDESGIENIVTNFQSTYISQCYYETEE